MLRRLSLTSADALAEALARWRWPRGIRCAIAIGLLLAMILGTGALVYFTGGTRYAYLHAAYIPILVAAFFFGPVGSILTAVAMTLVIGPWMPLNVLEGLQQPLTSWAVRSAFFVTFGIVCGLLLWKFDPDASGRQLRTFKLLSELRDAIAADELQLYYQPKIDLRSGRCVGAEALLRWPHRERGLLLPAEFIPQAEQTGLIKDLTVWVVAAALRQLATWHSMPLHLSVAVNVSAHDLEDDRFLAQLEDLLARDSVSANRLELEITETVVMADLERAVRILNALKAIGVHVVIDDFGAGQASFTYLASLPADEVKIDRAFVTDMIERPKHSCIVRSAIELGHALGMKVIAEGVETQSVCDRLRAQGCDVAQGYLFAHPMPAADFERWLQTRCGTLCAVDESVSGEALPQAACNAPPQI
jgi:EAL domain-containing protein (putative c-di-GMP-specific phosphodiesterase class I)